MNCGTRRIYRGAAVVVATSVRRQLLSKLTHVDPLTSTPQMVDVSAKESTVRYAHARAIVLLPAILTRMLTSKRSNDPDCNKGDDNTTESEIHTVKGPVFTTAIIAGVMAAKRTPDLIPFCHSLSLEDCQVKIRVISSSVPDVIRDNNLDYSRINRSNSGDSDSPIISAHHSNDDDHAITRVSVDCMVKTTGKTGVEMEAMVGASTAALCIYDMLKAVSHEIEIAQVRLISKSGGKNTYTATSS